MTKLTRRKTVIGLLGLAGGAGATITSAAFEESVAPDADMRVVVGEEVLRVRAGAAFRDDDDEYDPEEGEDWAFEGDTSLFSNGGLGDISTEDLDENDGRVASANSDTNGALEIETAVFLDDQSEVFTFPELIEITNEGEGQSEDIGIKFSEFGDDVDGYGDGDGDVEMDDVLEIYSFNASGDTISSDPEAGAGDDVADQDVANTITVDPGETVQIELEVDLEGEQGTITSASAPEGAPFGNESGVSTVDLVNEIEVGTNPGVTDG